MRLYSARTMSGVIGAASMVGAFWTPALAVQQPRPTLANGTLAVPMPGTDSVTVAAGARYRAGDFRRWFSGDLYRDLWTTPIRVPVLDLEKYAGGLKPTKTGGGMQTKTLQFDAADGREFVFRTVDKSGTTAPIEVRKSPANELIQDQVSAMHPAGAEIAAPIEQAAGILHPVATLVVMPDDSTLGKYRKEFAGRLGMIEELPKAPKEGVGFGGATKVIDSPELLKQLETDPKDHVDSRAFLAARLTDFLINDNDRNWHQWKWARIEGESKHEWEPIARDRDHAFVSYDGLMDSFGRLASASVVKFNDVVNTTGLTVVDDLDRRLLSELPKTVWDSVANAIQRRVTDSVIHAAVRAMPPEYWESGPKMEDILKRRRAGIPNAADEYYRRLAARVLVHGTDSADVATIRRVSDKYVEVRLESGGTIFYSRRFDVDETREILVYLHGGDDTAVVSGNVGQSILVRVIGGNGTNTFVDSSAVGGARHPTRFYDAGKTEGASYGPDTIFERRPWEHRYGTMLPPLNDDGASIRPSVGLSSTDRLGLTPKFGLTRYSYGFLDRPYESKLSVQGAWATGFNAGSVAVLMDRRFESSPLHVTALGRVSDIQVVGFNGFGNATSDSGHAQSFFDVHQRQWLLNPAVGLSLGSWTDISLGPVVQHSVVDSARSPFLAETRPYGFGTFDQAGLMLNAKYERVPAPGEDQTFVRDRYLVQATGAYYPAMWDVRSPFEVASLALGASFELPIATRPLFVARAGGKKLFGDFPFYEAAMLGGHETTQYITSQRYAGDGSLYATSELYVPLARFTFLIPARAGVTGVAESGRVYYQGTSPDGWHSTVGGGIWIGRMYGSEMLSIVQTTGEQHGLQFRLGLSF
jgi:hypothetical protein